MSQNIIMKPQETSKSQNEKVLHLLSMQHMMYEKACMREYKVGPFHFPTLC